MSDSQARTNYEALEDEMKALHAIDHALGILHWDEQVMISKRGVNDRAESMALLESMSHEKLVSEKLGEFLDGTAQESVDSWQRANLREIARRRDVAHAVPKDLIVALTRASARCLESWRNNRMRNDWHSTAPLLGEVINLVQQKAQCLADYFGVSPYDALLSVYEEGLAQSHIDVMFDDLCKKLPDLIEDALTHQSSPPAFDQRFSIEDQMEFSKELMKALGFDFDRGRIDTSHHPFTAGSVYDSRITTRFKESNFTESTFATIHETGHALYVQGLPTAWHRQPVGEACGMMIHESQSLFMEMQVSRSDAFLEFLRKASQRRFAPDSSGPCWTTEGFRNAVRHVEKGLIRVDSDELTYPLHVILRYELEKPIMGGELPVSDIPGEWSQKMQNYFGISTEGDFTNGCMQDVHWYDGIFGYFPCYSMGAITAAQFFSSFVEENGSPESDFSEGNVEAVVQWLRKNVHSKGRFLNGLDLIADTTGRPLGLDCFYKHLRSRYLGDNA